ncbi:MAG: signal peptidase I [Bacilli bacterium]|nr:signal peptidase I [Bacilli bacterium]MDD4066119.1 signal peptidase I [Bacilli bacterium]
MSKQRVGLTSTEEIDKLQNKLDQEISGDKKNRKKRERKKILNRVGWIVVSGLAVLVIGVMINSYYQRSLGNIPSFLGVYLFRIESGSMEPTIEVGDVIVSVGKSSADQMTVGTVVTFKNTSGIVVTHRIVEIVYSETNPTEVIGYRTKGDNPENSVDVEMLTYDRIIAVCKFRINL